MYIILSIIQPSQVPNSQLKHLQYVQNSLARAVVKMPKFFTHLPYSHIVTSLKYIHEYSPLEPNFTHYANHILLILCLSHRNRQLCHIISHHSHPIVIHHFFIPVLKPIFCTIPHHRVPVPTGLLSWTLCPFLISCAHRSLFLVPVFVIFLVFYGW